MALSDYQVSFAGLTLGDGTVYVIENIIGLGLGPKRSKEYEIPGADGVTFGREYRNGKTLTLEGEVVADTSAQAWTAILALEAAWDGSNRKTPRATQELRLKFPGQAERVVLGRPDQFDYDPRLSGHGIITWQATFKAVAR